MKELLIPAHVLASKELFKSWVFSTYRNLYGENFIIKGNPYDLMPKEDAEAAQLVDIMMLAANQEFNGSDKPIEFRSKNRKLNCNTSDLLACVIYILYTRCKGTATRIAKATGLNHSTVLYHKNRIDGLMQYRDFRIKFEKTIKKLENERFIPTLERFAVES